MLSIFDISVAESVMQYVKKKRGKKASKIFSPIAQSLQRFLDT